MSFGNVLENAILNAIFNAGPLVVLNAYISLHTGNPGETGANEVAGGSYVRKTVPFSTALTGSCFNETDVLFPLMPSCTLSHVGIWTEETGGDFLWGGAMSGPLVVSAGALVQIDANDLEAILD